MTTLSIETASVFRPLCEADDARYLCAHGGRNGGKSWFFASLLVEQCLRRPGTLAVCVREHLKSLQESAKRNVEQTIQALGVGSQFEVQYDKIKTPGGGLIIFVGMQDHTAESIKSLEGYRICWIEEAQTITARSLALLRPTIRAEGSQIWFSWNPRRRNDAVDQFLRGSSTPDGAIIVKSGWRTNPWHNAVMEQERLTDKELYPGSYDHVCEGGYAVITDGAYFAKELTAARAQGRINGTVTAEPTLPLKSFWDLGGAGAKGDATAIWIAQFVGMEIRLLDYLEYVGQPLGFIVNELRSPGYDNIACTLPHDGVNASSITGKRPSLGRFPQTTQPRLDGAFLCASCPAASRRKRLKRAHQARLESHGSKNPLIGNGIASITLP